MSDISSEVRSLKAALRRTVLQSRKQLAESERANAGRAIAAHVGALLASIADGRAEKSVVSGFLPIGDELDSRPALETARAMGHRICLPVMVGRNDPLQFREWKQGDAMVQRQWGIAEPTQSAQILEPDVLLMPLLAFDAAGGRLGYGGGYYDRTLAQLRSRRSVLAVGIAFDQQEVDSVPCLDYDQRLDWVLTPTRSLRSA